MKSYPNYQILDYIWAHLPPKARIGALSTGNSYYVERPFYAGWTHTPTLVEDQTDFASRLAADGITHVFVNQHAVQARHWEDAWLNQPQFQERYLSESICADGQCLYAVKNLPALQQ